MARIARVVAPLYPHHITQRGNRRQQTFFNDEDYLAYLELMSEWCREYRVEAWAYCLMPNHVHLILVPETKDGLNLAVGKAHKRYTRRINFREGWRGHLWQGRFASFVMDDNYLLSCTKYIELNPVRAGLVKRPEEWPFSSTRAHIEGRDDILIKSKPMTDRISKPWGRFLSNDVGEDEMDHFRKHERTGRPVGAYNWGALPELIEQGETGFLVPCKHVEAAAERIRFLCDNLAQITLMGAKDRMKALKYNIQTMKRQLQTAFEGSAFEGSGFPYV